MSINLARLSPPGLTPTEIIQVRELVPVGAGVQLQQSRLRSRDGRQDFPHFWFYPLLAAPFVRVALAVGTNPAIGFTALNILLLLGVAALLSTRLTQAAILLMVAGPILWWLDKPHTEVFTFSLIAGALVLLRSAPWWSLLALGAAATQNPPVAAAMMVVIAFALRTHGWRDRRVWLASIAGTILAGLHPLYYYSRLGILSGLTVAVDRHWPSFRELTTVLIDPNLSVFVHDPILLVAVVIAILVALVQPKQLAFDLADGTAALVAVLFLLSFTQTTNFNHGGTPGPSRYGLWLIPFAVLILGRIQPMARWMRGLAAGSVVWCVWAFAPALPEQYVRASVLASSIWRSWPAIDNPVAEVFAERVSGREPARPPVAMPGCEKLLLMGNGNGAAWPARCSASPVPEFCRQNGALCYANETGGTYRFVKAPATPAWRSAVTNPDDRVTTSSDEVLVITHPDTGGHLALWYDEGWSYPERLSEPTPDAAFREWRWIDQTARMGVSSAEPIVASLTLVAHAFNKPRRLRISIDGHEISTLLVTTDIHEYRTPEFHLGRGRTLVTFDSLDGSDAPSSDDSRRLSIQFFRVELVATK